MKKMLLNLYDSYVSIRCLKYLAILLLVLYKKNYDKKRIIIIVLVNRML